MKVLYKCDPVKNKPCKKTNCFMHGGRCNSTVKLEFARQPVEIADLVLEEDEELEQLINPKQKL